MFYMFGRIGAHKKGPHRTENVGQQRGIFWSMGSLYGVLRHLKVHFAQHDILSVGLCHSSCHIVSVNYSKKKLKSTIKV